MGGGVRMRMGIGMRMKVKVRVGLRSILLISFHVCFSSLG